MTSYNWNELSINPSTRIKWRASLVPAAAVIPAPLAYIKIVAVKTFEVYSCPTRDPRAAHVLTWDRINKCSVQLLLTSFRFFGENDTFRLLRRMCSPQTSSDSEINGSLLTAPICFCCQLAQMTSTVNVVACCSMLRCY